MTTGQTQHNKKGLFLLRAGRSCPLNEAEAGFNAIVVYSFLVYRLKMAKGVQERAAVNAKQIKRGTGLCRSRTIPKALDLLEQHGLLARSDRRVFAMPSRQADWFVEMKNSQHKPWYSRIAYQKIWLPTSKPANLTPRHNALYWTIRSRPNQRQKYYALRLQIDEKTVSRAITRLRLLGLLHPNRVEALKLEPEHLSLWQDQPNKRPRIKEFRLSQQERIGLFIENNPLVSFNRGNGKTTVQHFENHLDAIGQRMQAAGYSTADISAYWEHALVTVVKKTNALEPFERFVTEFPKIFDHVESVTLANRVSGTFTGANSLGLLDSVTRRAIDEIAIAWSNLSSFGAHFPWNWSAN